MSRVYEVYQLSENLLIENKLEIETTENNITFLKKDKSLVEEELAEAKKQVELLSSDLKQIREVLKNETLELKNLSKEKKVIANIVKTLKPTPAKSWGVEKMKAELLAIYIKSSDDYVRSSTKNTLEARHIKLFDKKSQAISFVHNYGIVDYDYKIVKVIFEVVKWN